MSLQDSGTRDHWYALFTRYQHEKLVATALSNKSFDVYLPAYRAVHRWQDRDKQLSLPLFPCYVFLRGGLDRQLQILTTPGLLHIVSWGGRPAVIPPVQIEAVKQILGSGLPVKSHPYMRCGDRVRVKSGPLMGLEGILERTKGQARLVLSMEMLGRAAAVEIESWNLERIGPLPAVSIPRSNAATA